MQTTNSIIYDREGNVAEHSTITAPSPASSVEIATDSKGVPKPTVKVYHEDPDEAARTALRLYRQLSEALKEAAI